MQLLTANFWISNLNLALVDFSFCLTLIAYVYFSGQTKGHVRFVEENAAVELAAKMKEKLAEEKLKVKEADISYR